MRLLSALLFLCMGGFLVSPEAQAITAEYRFFGNAKSCLAPVTGSGAFNGCQIDARIALDTADFGSRSRPDMQIDLFIDRTYAHGFDMTWRGDRDPALSNYCTDNCSEMETDGTGQLVSYYGAQYRTFNLFHNVRSARMTHNGIQQTGVSFRGSALMTNPVSGVFEEHFFDFGTIIPLVYINGALQNPAAVPLPASAWLLVAAFGGFGILRRRRNSTLR